MRKEIAIIFTILLLALIFIFKASIVEAAKCCCYYSDSGTCSDCYLETGNTCLPDGLCNSTSKSDCTSSNCGSTTTCGGTTYYCCRTSATSATYSWQSSSCSIPCDAECNPGDTRSCSVTVSYNYCDGKTCKSTSGTYNCGSQTCGSNYHWGTCTSTSNCPQSECSDNGDCGMTCGDYGGAQCYGGSCSDYCNGCGGVKVCIPGSQTYDCTAGSYCVACKNEACKCSNTHPDGSEIDDDVDGLPNCKDPDCAGKEGPGGVICCQSNSDCPSYNSTNHLKMYCDSDTHTCRTKPSCLLPEDCEDNWCCDKDPSLPSSCRLSGSCVAKGTLMCNNQYICDPPEGFVSSSSENANIQTSKKLTLLDLLINPFSYFLKK